MTQIRTTEPSKHLSEQPKLGECLRAMRRRHGLTLQDVSKRTGVALSTLSKVENDLMSLTYDKIVQICTGLGIPITELLSTEGQQRDVPRTRRSIVSADTTLVHETKNYQYSYLCTDLIDKRMVPIVIRLRARDIRDFDTLVRHAGEEFVYVLDGEIEVHTEHYAPARIRAGQGFYIDSTMGHAFLAAGPQDAMLLCVCSAPESELERVFLERA